MRTCIPGSVNSDHSVSSHPLVVGLGGGMGSGKSTVARFLANKGWVVIDLDDVVRQHSHKKQTIWVQFVLNLGRFCLDQDGRLDRKKIGSLMFRNRSVLLTLNRQIHPFLKRWTRKIIRQQKSVKRVVVDGSVLFEAGFLPLLDKLVYVEASPDDRINRLIEKGLSEREAKRRIPSQIFLSALKRRAQVILRNENSLVELERLVGELESSWTGRKERFF